MSSIVKYFLRGLLVVLPVAGTLYVLYWIFTVLNDAVFSRLGERVSEWFPGSEGTWVSTALGVLTTLLLIIGAGVFASNLLGGAIIRLVEKILARLPLVKLLYGSLKDLLGAFVGDKKSFRQPVCISVGGAKTLGFITRDSMAAFGLEDHVAVYIPQSYNFAGNLLLFRKEEVLPIRAHSSDVMTFLVSGGVSGSSTSR